MIRVLLIIDVPFYREGLTAVLSQSADVTVVGAVSDANAALKIAARQTVDVVLLDTGADKSTEILAQWNHSDNAAPVVALAIGETPEKVIEWAEAGVQGYVPRSAALTDLLECLRYAVRGEAYCSPRIMSIVLHRLTASRRQPPQAVEQGCQLTGREQQIVELVARGLPNKAIAARLHISHATAKNHVHHILGKLNLTNRAELAAYLHARGRVADSTPE